MRTAFLLSAASLVARQCGPLGASLGRVFGSSFLDTVTTQGSALAPSLSATLCPHCGAIPGSKSPHARRMRPLSRPARRRALKRLKRLAHPTPGRVSAARGPTSSLVTTVMVSSCTACGGTWSLPGASDGTRRRSVVSRTRRKRAKKERMARRNSFAHQVASQVTPASLRHRALVAATAGGGEGRAKDRASAGDEPLPRTPGTSSPVTPTVARSDRGKGKKASGKKASGKKTPRSAASAARQRKRVRDRTSLSSMLRSKQRRDAKAGSKGGSGGSGGGLSLEDFLKRA